ncbi:PREDICTED: uncharacterized protein LOC109223520 [Nicotiana attenuata]|uniref:Coenzyme Q-binding protein COQ10 START domain-containing protein n=1 Tax=Nicotiana attenuata TaxID=49451 RepID=A0A1J6ITT9_NICAT|nr:PREDICTED: uncharacterized protein LOC109223520 [Nicotiana attenuata]OIT07668.1 hypothetical protein A4A49_05469 [Nicotiana attenuata]
MAMPIFSSSTLRQMSATAAVPASSTTMSMSAAATSASAAHKLNHNQLIVSLNVKRKSISASSSSFISRYPFHCNISRSFRKIPNPSPIRIRPISPVMELQDCTVKMEVDVPISVAYKCYSDREAIPQWMPFISSVKILEDKPDLSRWSLKYKAFGQDIEYSWLARNMQPTPNQKIHWRSLEGLPNRGAVRFFPKGPSSCIIELTVSYEVPQLLVPVASALQPFLENLLRRGLERFATFAKSYSADTPK